MTTTMQLAEQKVGRLLDAAETISTSRWLSSGLFLRHSIVVGVASFWRIILNDRTPKFIPFFATLGCYII